MARGVSSGPGPRSSADRLGRVVAPGDQGWSASLHSSGRRTRPESTDDPILAVFGLRNKEICQFFEANFAMRNKGLRQRGEVID